MQCKHDKYPRVAARQTGRGDKGREEREPEEDRGDRGWDGLGKQKGGGHFSKGSYATPNACAEPSGEVVFTGEVFVSLQPWQGQNSLKH